MELSLQDEKTELTSKEADLLFLLHTDANATVKSAVMLKVVWIDERDYVRRTLDVFVSKLRKKHGADTSVKIESNGAHIRVARIPSDPLISGLWAHAIYSYYDSFMYTVKIKKRANGPLSQSTTSRT